MDGRAITGNVFHGISSLWLKQWRWFRLADLYWQNNFIGISWFLLTLEGNWNAETLFVIEYRLNINSTEEVSVTRVHIVCSWYWFFMECQIAGVPVSEQKVCFPETTAYINIYFHVTSISKIPVFYRYMKHEWLTVNLLRVDLSLMSEWFTYQFIVVKWCRRTSKNVVIISSGNGLSPNLYVFRINTCSEHEGVR